MLNTAAFLSKRYEPALNFAMDLPGPTDYNVVDKTSFVQ